jgi:hypothetical protein
MFSRCRLGLPALLALLAPLASGCPREHPYGEVEGVVTLDGKPLAHAEVVFMPDPEKGNSGRRSVALTDDQGHYRIASDAGRSGAPVGAHRVCVNDMLAGSPGVPPPAGLPDENAKGPAGTQPVPAGPGNQKCSRFPPAYSSAIDTPFRDIEVKEASQVINLELKSH